LLQKIVRSVQD